MCKKHPQKGVFQATKEQSQGDATDNNGGNGEMIADGCYRLCICQ
jgi:hypothetical protein